MHGNILHQLLEVFGASNEVALAVDFKQDADFAAGMNVGAHRALVGGARRFLLRAGHAALAQDNKRLLNIALGLLEGLEAIAHGRAGLLAKLLYQLCSNLLAHSSHLSLFPNLRILLRPEVRGIRKAWHELRATLLIHARAYGASCSVAAFGCFSLFQQGRHGRRGLADTAAKGRFKIDFFGRQDFDRQRLPQPALPAVHPGRPCRQPGSRPRPPNRRSWR